MTVLSGDDMRLMGGVFAIVPTIAYAYICYTVFTTNMTLHNHRVMVLCTRACIFLPIYAWLMFIDVCDPHLMRWMELLLCVVEGYSFYCFFSMVVTNTGGPEATIVALAASEEPMRCACFCPEAAAAKFKRATNGLFHFLFTRTLVVVAEVVLEEAEYKGHKVINAFLALGAMGLLSYGVLSVLTVFENLHH